MARRVRDIVLESRNARRALKVSGKPYWRSLDKGLHLGYRKRSGGGSWVARRFTDAGKYSESKLGAADDFQDADGIKTLTYFQAMEEARRWCGVALRSENDDVDSKGGSYTVDDAVRDYMANYEVEGKGIAVVKTIVNAHISPELGKIRVDKLNTKKLENWHRGIATIPARLRTKKTDEKQKTKESSDDAEIIRRRRSTANRNLTVLKAALNYAWRQGKTPSDTAWRRVKPFKNVDAPVIRYLNEAECARLVNTCPADLRLMVQAALLTGCRYGELIKLVVSDFRPDTGTVAIRTSKSGKPRHVVLTEEAKEFFEQAVVGKKGSDPIFTHEDGILWGKSHQSRPILEACQRAKIDPPITFHVLRHTHGSFLAMKGVPMPVIAKQLGHADTRMTEKHYAHISPSYVADTIRQNFPTLGIVRKSNVETMQTKKK
jgi:integrase